MEPHSPKHLSNNYLDLPSCAGQLYWLAYTLTGDETKARSTFQASVDELVEGSTHVFHDWMCHWARRLVIEATVGIVQADLQRSVKLFASSAAASLEPNGSDRRAKFFPLTPASLQNSLLKLDIFPRFAFVLRTLEAYSRKKAARLLNVDTALSEAANVYAIRFLSGEFHNSAAAALHQQNS